MFGTKGLVCRNSGSEFRVLDLGSRVKGQGSRVKG